MTDRREGGDRGNGSGSDQEAARGLHSGSSSKRIAKPWTSPSWPAVPEIQLARERPVIQAPASTTAVPAIANGAM